jgi:hypothetical protein
MAIATPVLNFAPIRPKWVMIALLLSLFSLADVISAARPDVECRNDNLYLLDGFSNGVTDGFGRPLLTKEGRRCELVLGRIHVPLPSSVY